MAALDAAASAAAAPLLLAQGSTEALPCSCACAYKVAAQEARIHSFEAQMAALLLWKRAQGAAVAASPASNAAIAQAERVGSPISIALLGTGAGSPCGSEGAGRAHAPAPAPAPVLTPSAVAIAADVGGGAPGVAAARPSHAAAVHGASPAAARGASLASPSPLTLAPARDPAAQPFGASPPSASTPLQGRWTSLLRSPFSLKQFSSFPDLETFENLMLLGAGQAARVHGEDFGAQGVDGEEPSTALKASQDLLPHSGHGEP